jgi:hypothetical protein
VGDYHFSYAHIFRTLPAKGRLDRHEANTPIALPAAAALAQVGCEREKR